MSTLTKHDSSALDEFLRLIPADYGKTDGLREMAIRTVKYLRSKKSDRTVLEEEQGLQKIWYQSIDIGAPDYSVYDTEYYLAELWACWVVYSRKYLLSIQSPRSLNGTSICEHIGNPIGILDLGCGFGYTTMALKEMFPSASVIGTNLDNTIQVQIARMLGAVNNFDVVSRLSDINIPITLIFASEYFEHIPEPIEHLRSILKLAPQQLLIANTFSAKAIGHFDRYFVDGAYYNGRKTSRLFNDALRSQGYKKINTNLWNNRPSYWIRDE